MSNLIIGYGVQGQKRLNHINRSEKVYVYDPINKHANSINSIDDFDFGLINNIYLCTPDHLKLNYINKFVKLKKNILVEKPLNFPNNEFKKILKNNYSKLYTAYNHRFEPHIVKIKSILQKNLIGRIYHIDIHYGNGTIQLWKDSWRSKEKYSILYDLGSHVLDMILYLFGNLYFDFRKSVCKMNELNCYDYFSFFSNKNPSISCTLSTINWKNFFSLNIIGEKGSINMDGLCKWGPSILKIRKRTFPSGVPSEKVFKIEQKDPTWKAEEIFFKKKIPSNFTNLRNDILINSLFHKIINEN